MKYLKGGHDKDGTVINTTEIIHANGTVEDGPDLPPGPKNSSKSHDAHCMVLLPPGTKVMCTNYYTCPPPHPATNFGTMNSEFS